MHLDSLFDQFFYGITGVLDLEFLYRKLVYAALLDALSGFLETLRISSCGNWFFLFDYFSWQYIPFEFRIPIKNNKNSSQGRLIQFRKTLQVLAVYKYVHGCLHFWFLITLQLFWNLNSDSNFSNTVCFLAII